MPEERDNDAWNLGCVVLALGAPALGVFAVAAILSGGGCEGHQGNCTSHATWMWVVLGAAAVGLVGLALGINKLVDWLRSQP